MPLKKNTLSSIALFICILFFIGCEAKNSNPIPPPGTEVTTSSEVYKQTARGLAEDCSRLGNCSCSIDGIRTTCSLVFSCLDVGFCRQVVK